MNKADHILPTRFAVFTTEKDRRSVIYLCNLNCSILGKLWHSEELGGKCPLTVTYGS